MLKITVTLELYGVQLPYRLREYFYYYYFNISTLYSLANPTYNVSVDQLFIQYLTCISITHIVLTKSSQILRRVRKYFFPSFTAYRTHVKQSIYNKICKQQVIFLIQLQANPNRLRCHLHHCHLRLCFNVKIFKYTCRLHVSRAKYIMRKPKTQKAWIGHLSSFGTNQTPLSIQGNLQFYKCMQYEIY